MRVSMRPSGPKNVEAMNPVAQRLAIHAADLRRRSPVHFISNRSQRQKTTALAHALSTGQRPCEALPPNSLVAISQLMAWREFPAPKESEISPHGNLLHQL